MMNTIYIPYPTPPLVIARQELARAGIPMVEEAEDAEYLLYPAPTALTALGDYTADKTLIGGNLDFLNPTVRRIDLLKDPHYLAANAAITAEAALGLILNNLNCSITEAEILILGWGRIGKCLTHQLKVLDTHLTVFARNPSDRALLTAMGYRAIRAQELTQELPKFRVIVNTAPAPILADYDVRLIAPDCFKMDLASTLSIPGDGVLHAKGLPGKCKPEASGELIAQTILRLLPGGA